MKFCFRCCILFCFNCILNNFIKVGIGICCVDINCELNEIDVFCRIFMKTDYFLKYFVYEEFMIVNCFRIKKW